MPRELTEPQRLWVEALRSGEFKQGVMKLQSNGRYCCLGVACAIAESHGVHVNRDYGVIAGANLGNQRPVQHWLRLRDGVGNARKFTLVALNDSGKTFPEIADFIEAHADELFVEEAA